MVFVVGGFVLGWALRAVLLDQMVCRSMAPHAECANGDLYSVVAQYTCSFLRLLQ